MEAWYDGKKLSAGVRYSFSSSINVVRETFVCVEIDLVLLNYRQLSV